MSQWTAQFQGPSPVRTRQWQDRVNSSDENILPLLQQLATLAIGRQSPRQIISQEKVFTDLHVILESQSEDNISPCQFHKIAKIHQRNTSGFIPIYDALTWEKLDEQKDKQVYVC